jgi:hypothetical protein
MEVKLDHKSIGVEDIVDFVLIVVDNVKAYDDKYSVEEIQIFHAFHQNLSHVVSYRC